MTGKEGRMVHNNSEFSGFFLMDRQKRWKWARLVMLTLTLALMLPGNAFARERDAVFEIERLDAGLMMYVYSEEDPGLKTVEEGEKLTLSRYNSKIYFYIGARLGYRITDISGTGVHNVPDLKEDTNAPGAEEARAAGCTKWMSFTHSYGAGTLHRTIQVSGELLVYHVIYEAEGAEAPVDSNAYTVAEGSNMITLAEAPAKKEHRFNGWQLGQEQVLQAGETLTVDEALIALADDGYFCFHALWVRSITYTTEYYLESEKGVYPQEPALKTVLEAAEEGSAVKADTAPAGLETAGYALDTEFEKSVLSGTASADNALTLRVFYALDANGNGIADRYELSGGEGETEGGEEEPGEGGKPGEDGPETPEAPGSGPDSDTGTGSGSGGSGGESQSGENTQAPADAQDGQQPVIGISAPETELPLEKMEEESGAEDSGSSADGAEEVPASGYRLLEVASAEGSENAGGLPSDQEASESDGTGAKDEGALDEDPVPLANLQTTGQSQPVYWLLFLAVLAAGAVGILLYKKEERELQRRLADAIADQMTKDRTENRESKAADET